MPAGRGNNASARMKPVKPPKSLLEHRQGKVPMIRPPQKIRRPSAGKAK